MRAHTSEIREHKLLMRFLAPVVDLARGMEQERLDLFAPEGIVDHLYAKLGAVIDRIPRPVIATGLIAILRDDAFWNKATSEAGLRPQEQALCDYFRTLNASWPYASTILLMGSRYFRRRMSVDCLRAIGYLQRASSTHQEHRAEWLRHASTPIIESLYYELVSLVYAAERLRRGERFVSKRGGGQLQVIARETARSLPGLFAENDGRVRNAAVHCDRWSYFHASDSIHMTDNGWSNEYSTTDLLKKLRSLLQNSLLPFHVSARLHGPDARHILRALLTNDPSVLPDGIAADYARTDGELRRLGWAPTSDR